MLQVLKLVSGGRAVISIHDYLKVSTLRMLSIFSSIYNLIMYSHGSAILVLPTPL